MKTEPNEAVETAPVAVDGPGRPLFYINLTDWTWWAWAATTVLLFVGLSGFPLAFIGAMAVTVGVGQGIVLLVRDRGFAAFSVQLRTAYLALLLISYVPQMRWLYWLPAVGTLALVLLGYCLLARILSLLPWNNREAYSLARLRRTFLSAPDLRRVPVLAANKGCAGGLCTIEAQVAPAIEMDRPATSP
ncbi:hypothetical protein [Luteolibacter soli]|uniref:Uncharacterized protein n=1 Tax=Luteolibacter soli TaxID=3135280 RepID=A0ABU9ARR1_9BACT